MKAGFRRIKAICVPAEIFTDGYDAWGEMEIPGRKMISGREKSDPAALLLATAAVVNAGDDQLSADMLQALEKMGFRTQNIAQANQIQGKTEKPFSGTLVRDTRIRAYLYGDWHVPEAAGLKWEHIPESDTVHYAAAGYDERLTYLGCIRIHRIPRADRLAMEQVEMAKSMGVRVLMMRRPSAAEFHPQVKVLGRDEKADSTDRKDFAVYVREWNDAVRKNRLIASGVAGILLTIAIILAII